MVGFGGTPLLEWGEGTNLPIFWFVCLLGLKRDEKVKKIWCSKRFVVGGSEGAEGVKW